MKFIIKNQKGFSILQALVVGGILIGSSMTILQIATISQKSNDQLQKVLSEKEIKKNLSNFLSSKYECYKSLNGAIALNDSQQVVLNQSLAENNLRNSLQSSSHSINFENLDFRFRFPSAGEALSYPNSATSNSDTIYKRIPVVAETYYKKISSKKLIGMKSSGSQNDLNMSILAKFTRFNTTSPWRFVSCDGSNAKEVEELNVGAGDIAERKQKCEDFYGEFGADQKCQIHTKKANCLMVGGTFANGDCIFKSHDYIVNGLNIQKITNDKLNFHDSLCEIETDISRQLLVSSKPIHEQDQLLFSSNCSKVRYGGCNVDGNFHSSGTYIGERFIGEHGPDSYGQVINDQFYNGLASKNQRIANQMAQSIRQKQELQSLFVDSRFQQSRNGTNFQTRMMSSFVTGAVSGVLFGDPLLGNIFGGLVPKVLSSIFRCNKNRKVFISQSCMAGKLEPHYVRTEKKRFKCKRFRCKCHWENEGTFHAPNETELATIIAKNATVNFTKFDSTNTPLDEEVLQADVQGEMFQLKESISKSKTIDEFYKLAKQFQLENGEDSLSVNTSGDEDFSSDIQKMFAEKEKVLWEEFIQQLSLAEVSSKNLTQTLALVQEGQHKIISYTPNIQFVSKADSIDRANNVLKSRVEKLVTNIESDIQSASSASELTPISQGLNGENSSVITSYSDNKETLSQLNSLAMGKEKELNARSISQKGK